ncbi:MAG: hypothetical protein GY828_04725 [Candidatus Gracilibacteria bacterium]|nr:hypothetical protein [Candidatus Gracilibacteria bacterium]
MRKILQNRRRNIQLTKSLEKQAKQPQSNFEVNATIAALLVFVIHYIFEIQYLEVLGFIIALSAAIQKGKNIGKSEGFEEGFMEGFDKGCE